MIGLELRIIGLAIIGLALVGGVIHYRDLRARVAQGEVDARKLEAISAIAKSGEEAATDRVRLDAQVAISGSENDRLTNEAQDNDPNRADAPFPDRLRELARERRLARERSANPAPDDRL